MTTRTFYRLSVWLPIALPCVVWAITHWLRGTELGPLAALFGLFLASLVYAGIPYTALALWATWRIGSLTEPEVTRLMMKTPFLMMALVALFFFLAGLRVGRPEFGILGLLSAVIVVPVGYGYVGIVLLLREALGPRLLPLKEH